MGFLLHDKAMIYMKIKFSFRIRCIMLIVVKLNLILQGSEIFRQSFVRIARSSVLLKVSLINCRFEF